MKIKTFKIKVDNIALAFFILFTLLFSICFAQTKDENSVRNILETQQKAWNNGSIQKFMDGYWKSDSLMFVGKSGVTYGWQEMLAHYKKAYPDTSSMGILHFTLLQLKRLSNAYYFVVGKWQLKRTASDIEGYFTLLFKKINGQWEIVVDHTD